MEYFFVHAPVCTCVPVYADICRIFQIGISYNIFFNAELCLIMMGSTSVYESRIQVISD